MQGQQPTQTPAWSGNGVPASVRKPPAKRSRPPARKPPDLNSNQKFIPPKDLDLHLSKINPIPKNPFSRPKSTVRYGVRVQYGNLFPYYNQDLLDACFPVHQTAGYVEIRPHKGYIDFGFSSADAADQAAKAQVIYKDTPIPTIRTSHYSQSPMAIRFVNLPTHLPYDTLKQELIRGLLSYGSEPEIIFDIPKGITNISGPTAIATIVPSSKTTLPQIPPRAILSIAPDDPFFVQFEGAQKMCSNCKLPGHKKSACKLINLPKNSATGWPKPTEWGKPLANLQNKPKMPAAGVEPAHASVDALQTTHPDRSGSLANHQMALHTPEIESRVNWVQPAPMEKATNQITSCNLNQTLGMNCGSDNLSLTQMHTAYANTVYTTQNNGPPSNAAASASEHQIASCSLPPLEFITSNPFEVLSYYDPSAPEIEISATQITPQHWFEDEKLDEKIQFKPRNKFKRYVNSHSIAKKVKNINMPSQQVETLSRFNKAIEANIPRLAIPNNTPSELQEALEESTIFAKQCLEELVILTNQFISSRETSPHQRSTTKLVTARLDTNEALVNLAQTLYSYDSLSNGSTIMSFLVPHLADHPTPWLSAFERLPLEIPFEPGPPDDPIPMD